MRSSWDARCACPMCDRSDHSQRLAQRQRRIGTNSFTPASQISPPSLRAMPTPTSPLISSAQERPAGSTRFSSTNSRLRNPLAAPTTRKSWLRSPSAPSPPNPTSNSRTSKRPSGRSSANSRPTARPSRSSTQPAQSCSRRRSAALSVWAASAASPTPSTATTSTPAILAISARTSHATRQSRQPA